MKNINTMVIIKEKIALSPFHRPTKLKTEKGYSDFEGRNKRKSAMEVVCVYAYLFVQIICI